MSAAVPTPLAFPTALTPPPPTNVVTAPSASATRRIWWLYVSATSSHCPSLVTSAVNG
jgi:hypothetical protein